MAAREFHRVLAAEGVSNFGAMLSRLAIPWLAVLSLQATPLQMAWLGMADVAAGALGALAGAAAAPALGRRVGAGRAMALGLLAFALGTACVPLAGSALWLWGPLGVAGCLVLHRLVGDAGHALYEVHDRTLRQTAVPPDQLARADAGLRSLALAATLAAMLGGGLLGQVLGASGVLWLGVAAGAGAALLAALTLRQHR